MRNLYLASQNMKKSGARRETIKERYCVRVLISGKWIICGGPQDREGSLLGYTKSNAMDLLNTIMQQNFSTVAEICNLNPFH